MRASAFRDRWKLHIITVISSEILVPALRGIELYALEPHLCRPGKPTRRGKTPSPQSTPLPGNTAYSGSFRRISRR